MASVFATAPLQDEGVSPKNVAEILGWADDAEAVREILFEDWDPVGFAPLLPRDEYDDYIPAVVWLLRRRCRIARLEAHLVDVDRLVCGRYAG